MTAEQDWRDDPAWKLVDYAPDYFGPDRPVPSKPPAEAELAQPDTWCSLYAGNRLVATWARDSAP